MDPNSLYQQQPQQQNRASYPFTGNPQGSSTVMSAGAYSEQYITANVANNAAYLQTGTGINPMMRPVYTVPVASMASMTGNGRPLAKRALGSGAIFSNMGQTSGQNQLYTAGFPSQQQIMNTGRSTVPTQSFVNTDNQNMDGKSPAPIQQNAYAPSIKYFGQLQQAKPNSMGNSFNSLLNQNSSSHPQQSNQTIQEESQVDWLEFGDESDVVYDFNCSTEFTNNSSGMGSNVQGWNANSIQSNLNYASQNTSKSYSSINQNNLQQSPQQQHDDQQLQQQTISEQQQEQQSTPQPQSQHHSQPPSIQITQTSQQQQQLEDTGYTYSSISSLPLSSSSVSQNVSPKSIQNSSLGMLPRSPNASSDSNRQSLIYGSQNQNQTGSQIGQYSKMAPKDHLSSSNSMITNYSQSSTQSSISPEISSSGIQNAAVDHYNQSPQSTVESTSSNSLMSHLQGESSILTSNDNQNSFNTDSQVNSTSSRMASSTDIQGFNTEILSGVLHPINNNNNNNSNNNKQQQQQSSSQIGNIAQSSIAESVTPNLRLPINSGIAGRRNINSRQISRQSEKAVSVSNDAPLMSSSVPDQQSSIKSQPKPPKVNYAPKTRRVDSYGGLDLRVFEKFSLPLTIPGIQDLGAVDVHALTMSLKCGMKLEVTNALNTLTTLSCYRNVLIDLKQCGDLIDVLFDMILEYVDRVSPIDEKIAEEVIVSQRRFKSYRELYQLSKQECEEFADVTLEDSTISGEWLPLREQCWCVINMIRNFSFTNENHEYLATHPRFLTVLMRILYIGCDDNCMQDNENDLGSDVKTKRIKAIRKRAYDVLELRKSVLIILSNIAAYVPLPSIYVARDLLILIADFMDSMDDYYSQVALEVFAKLSVSYDNRQRIGGCDESTLTLFFNCLIQMLPKGENSIIGGGGGRLMAQELPYLVMAFYNFACLSGEGMRKKIVSTPGFINRMLKMSILLASIRDNRDEDCIMLSRRAMEMLKILAKGNEESFLVYTEQLLSALLTPYIDPVVVKDLESVMYPCDV